MFNLNDYEDDIAPSVEMMSCVGGIHIPGVKVKFPLNHGNYFSVLVGESKAEYEIVNMWYEDLQHLIETNVVSFPLKVKKLTNRLAIVFDPRVPPPFISEISYRAPQKFWSLAALTKRQLDIDSGRIKIVDRGDGFIFETSEIKSTRRTLKTGWSMEAMDDITNI